MVYAKTFIAFDPGLSLAVCVSAYFTGTGVRLFGSHGDQITTTAWSVANPIWRSYLVELDPLYCDVIVQRWEQFTGRKAEQVELPTSQPSVAISSEG